MATIKFHLTGLSAKNQNEYSHKTQSVFFRYRPSRNHDLILKTPFQINSKNWDLENQCWNKDQITKGAKTTETKKLNSDIEEWNRNLEDFKNDVEKYIDTILSQDAEQQKESIREYVSQNYFARLIKKEKATKTKTIPDNFTDLIDFYIDQRSVADVTKGVKPLADNTIKKYKTLQGVLRTYNRNLNATEINDVWRTDFVNYLNRLNYSANTQVKYIKDIKMLCKYASKDNKLSKQVLMWEINATPKNVSEYITFTFPQLEMLKTTEMPTERLSNARDWLLISCYTSVRVSELLTMKKENIIQDGEDYFIEVIEKKNQNKTGGLKYVYLLPQVVEILNKRSGDFPTKTSEQRYNDAIKEVCEKAGFDEIIEWGKTEVTKHGTRKVITKEPFHRFVTSHSGRATFVTLFKDKLPTEIIQMQTNHHSTEMVEHYNKTDNKIKMLQRAKTVAQAYKVTDDYREVKLKIV